MLVGPDRSVLTQPVVARQGWVGRKLSYRSPTRIVSGVCTEPFVALGQFEQLIDILRLTWRFKHESKC